MDKNEIEIPFGSNDSELIEVTYHIPKGMEAVIDGDKVIIRKKDSDDKKSNKAMLNACINALRTVGHSHLSDWLEKQGEQNSAWSEEDEDMIQALNACIDALIKGGMNYISFDSKSILIRKVKNWLKSFTKMVKMGKVSFIWSKEDERIRQCLIRDQEKALDDVRNDKYGHSEIISDLKEMYRERIKWLESLKERLKEE